MKNKLLSLFLSLSLSTQLVLLSCLLAMPAVTMIIHSGMEQRSDAVHKGFWEARRLVSNISTEQYNLTGDAEQLLIALSQIPDIKNRDVAATTLMLSNILKKCPQYGNIVVADRNGDVWASALPMTKSFSLKDRLTFQNAMKTGRLASGEYVIGSISAKATIGFASPIFNNNGKFDGVIAANLNFNNLNKMLQQAGLPKGSAFSIIDHNGFIIYRNINPEKYIGSRLSPELFDRMNNGSETDTFIDLDMTGEKRIISYGSMKLPEESSPYLYIRASIPLEGVLAKARQAELNDILILSPLLLIAILLAIPVGNFCFIQRIRKLQEASQQLADGDLQVKVSSVVAGGELGDLAQSFDRMARQLANRERQLYELNENLIKRVEDEIERRLTHERLLARHARLAAIGEMIGAIAHQWRQPLATLGAIIQSIRMAWDDKCLDKAFLNSAESDAQIQLYFMSDTIEGFRNFFNPEKVIERFDVRTKIQEVYLLVAPQCIESCVSLSITDDAAGIFLEITGYQNEFKQSILNLVSNSLDSIVEKAQLNWEDTSVGLIEIRIAAQGDNVVIEVRDNGCGIPAEYGDRIFEPYFTSKTEAKGTGIGLYMTKLIIEESMGGRLSYQSGPDGTSFRIELQRMEPGSRDGQ